MHNHRTLLGPNSRAAFINNWTTLTYHTRYQKFLIEYWLPTQFTMSMANWAQRIKLLFPSPKGYVPNAQGSSQLNCQAQHNKPWFLHPHLGPISHDAKSNNNSILNYWTQALNTIPERLPKCRHQNENLGQKQTEK